MLRFQPKTLPQVANGLASLPRSATVYTITARTQNGRGLCLNSTKDVDKAARLYITLASRLHDENLWTFLALGMLGKFILQDSERLAWFRITAKDALTGNNRLVYES